jgi:plastocyanin
MKRTVLAILISLVATCVGVWRIAASPVRDAKTVTITMKDLQFSPKNVTINVGDSIVWTNAETRKHTATADDNSFDTGVIAGGASSQPVKFDKPGTIPYYCQFHGGPGGVDMAGVITVVAAGGGQAATPAPTTAAPAATAAATAAPVVAPVGQVTFSDKAKGAHADQLTITFTSLPLPEEGKQYEAWIASETTSVSLGKVDVKADGTATITFADPKGANLINTFNAAFVTLQGDDLKTPGPIVYSGAIPPQADVHVKHVMAKFPDTPDNVGLLIGAIDQEAVLTQHVTFLNDAIKAGNVATAKLHLEHIHNIMTGKNGAKDLDGNGKTEVTPPSDGFGIFNYLTVASQHADLAAKQPDSTDNIKIKASHIKITAANATTILTQIQTLAIQAAGKATIADIKPIADQITKLNDTVVKGIPDSTGTVSPTKGSGGLGVAYAEGLAMASIALRPGDITNGKGLPNGAAAPAATAAATIAATTAANAATGGTVTVVLKDFEFSPKDITISVGQSIIFSNQGTKKHTATADDSSFDTGVLAPGTSSQPIKFDKAGTIPFYCQIHGGPGGVGMSGTITVK